MSAPTDTPTGRSRSLPRQPAGPGVKRAPGTRTGVQDGRASFREVLGVREFRTLLVADLLSLLGDQLAAVALGYLLFERTGSPFLAALGYAITWLPALLGGPVLAALADRFPPRAVMIGTDVGRAGLIALAAVPGLPLPALGALVLAAAMLAPPHEAARASLQVQILAGSRLAVGTALRNAAHQGSYLVGFGAGGAIVLLIGSSGALLVDAGTFVVSAVLLRVGLAGRPAAAPGARRSVPGGAAGRAAPEGTAQAVAAQSRAVRSELLAGLRAVAADRALAWPLALGAVGAAATVVPEALAPAYAARLSDAADHAGAHALTGPVLVGLLLAAGTGGNVIGGLLLGRFAPDGGRRLLWPLALAGMLPLALIGTAPGLWVTLLLLALAGAAGSFQVIAQTLYALAAPEQVRARVFGVAMAVVAGVQAIAATVAGALAERYPPSLVIAAAGMAGAGFLVCLRALSPDGAGGPDGAGRPPGPRGPQRPPIRHRPYLPRSLAARHRA